MESKTRRWLDLFWIVLFVAFAIWVYIGATPFER